MPKLSYLAFFVSGCMLLSCGVQEITRTGGLPPAASDTNSLHLASRMEDFIGSLSSHTFNGAVVLEKNGKLISGNGYGYALYDQKLPFTTKTITNTANLARQFTAAAVLTLKRDQKLKLDDPLSRFFDKIPSHYQDIQLIHLLQNTSGLPLELPEPAKAKTKEAFLKSVWQLPLLAPAGKEYHYSEVGYRLLAAVVESASGQDYETFLRKMILEPAGMYNTGYVLPDFQLMLQAKSRQIEEEEVLYLQYIKNRNSLWQLLGNSGMLSNAEDLFRWLEVLYKEPFLSAEDLELIKVASADKADNVSAFGWKSATGPGGSPVLLHQSSQNGYFCQLMFLPEENISLVVLANQLNGQVEKLGEQLVRVVLFPNYVPAPLPYTEQKLVRLPQEEEARHARALLAFLEKGTMSLANSLITQHYSPGFQAQVPERNHLDALDKLFQRLGSARLEKAEQSLPFMMFTFFSAEEGIWYQLRVQVNPHQSYKISTISLETTDAL